ncbi:MAG: hypothetical protein HY892_23040 [Deltaproteobacteria bacterium]|nr:hypothetical protein [Deltaproteobacteria bacterium]
MAFIIFGVGRSNKPKEGGIHTKRLMAILLAAFILVTVNGTAAAGGLFGPPQSISKEAGGLNTGIGYWYHEDKYQNDSERITRQNQIYSQLGYGTKTWEIYGRVGVSDLKILDAFRATPSSAATSKNDFEDHGEFFGTLGTKGFYPFNKTFGIGAFVQGSYYFTDFTDDVSGSFNGVPFRANLKVKTLWDVNGGIGFQATVPYGIKLYIGPYASYSEAKASLSPNLPDLKFETGEVTIKSATNIGGFIGLDVPLAKGFHLNVEGQFSARFSVGAVVTYSY